MVKEDVKSYKIYILIFTVIIFSLSIINFYLIRKLNSKSSNKDQVLSNMNYDVKKYGYTDMLDVLSKDSDLKIINMNDSLENKELLKVDIEYKDSIDKLYSYLKSIKNEGCFLDIENLKINIDDDNKESINFTAIFSKNK